MTLPQEAIAGLARAGPTSADKGVDGNLGICKEVGGIVEKACATCLCHSHLPLGTSFSKQNNQNKKTQNNNKNEICIELLGDLLRHFSSQCRWRGVLVLFVGNREFVSGPKSHRLEGREVGQSLASLHLTPWIVCCQCHCTSGLDLANQLICLKDFSSFSLALCGTLQGSFQASTRIKPIRAALELGELLSQW